MDRIAIAGTQLELKRIAGATSGPTLVFLHEGLGSVAQWRDFPERLAAATGLPALVYSRAGYGGSDPVPLPRPLTFMHDEARGALPALLDREVPNGDVVLVGHSDGASIALVYAAERPARVRALVLFAPHVFVEEICVRSIAAIAAEYARDPSPSGLRAKLARHHGANVDVAFHGWAGAWLDPAFRSWSLESFLPKIEAEVLVVQGEDDAYGTPAQIDAIARQCTGRVTSALLPQCGHSPHREAADEALSIAARFLAPIARSVQDAHKR